MRPIVFCSATPERYHELLSILRFTRSLFFKKSYWVDSYSIKNESDVKMLKRQVEWSAEFSIIHSHVVTVSVIYVF